jgi:protein-disulfide isomerase-like protein with CxxC motif
MIREQEKIRIANVYNAVKKALKNKGYRKKTTQVFAEIASEFGYEPRSVSNIYYATRKNEEKQLQKITDES